LSSDKQREFGPKFGAGTPLHEHHTTSLVFSDPPLHTRVRRLMMGALNQRAIARMEAGVLALVDGLLDALQGRVRADLIEDFAAQIPVEVIGNLLEVPRSERAPLRGWSLAILSALEPAPAADVLARGHAAVSAFLDYLRTLVAQRRRTPGDPDADVLTRLIQGEFDGERLSEAELLHNCIFLLNAGHETTTNLIANAVVELLEHPAEWARLRAEPALLSSAVEEFLRYQSPNQLGNRRVVADVAIGGVAMPEGTLVTLGIGAANRDPAHFPDPDRLDLGRTPNRHLAFITGIHACAGMWLARMEGAVAIGRLVERFARLRAAAPPVRARRARFRVVSSFPVAIG
ncbi:MAG TPA: cytochrome P450, partial [Candidatus Acidoferrum sp.]|nr:cytochrome P450 [Candidatus Acidoferrum sp.]